LLCRLLNGLYREVLSAYCEAKYVRHPQFCRNHKMLARILSKNPWIRTLRPRPNRLLVHAGDLRQYLTQKGVPDVFDLPAVEPDALLALGAAREIARRTAAERAEKTKRG